MANKTKPSAKRKAALLENMAKAFAPKRLAPKKLNGVRELQYQALAPKYMRYLTVGDYFEVANGAWAMQVADCGDWRYNALIFLHEFIELCKTQHDGISEPDIKKFDEWWNKKYGCAEGEDEPGFHPNAPYREAHTLATGIETIMAAALGVNWGDYAKAVDKAWDAAEKAGKK